MCRATLSKIVLKGSCCNVSNTQKSITVVGSVRYEVLKELLAVVRQWLSRNETGKHSLVRERALPIHSPPQGCGQWSIRRILGALRHALTRGWLDGQDRAMVEPSACLPVLHIVDRAANAMRLPSIVVSITIL